MSYADGIYSRVEMNHVNFYIIITHRLFIFEITSIDHDWKDATSGSANGEYLSNVMYRACYMTEFCSISNNIFTETTNIGNTLTVDTAILCIKFCRQ